MVSDDVEQVRAAALERFHARQPGDPVDGFAVYAGIMEVLVEGIEQNKPQFRDGVIVRDSDGNPVRDWRTNIEALALAKELVAHIEAYGTGGLAVREQQ